MTVIKQNELDQEYIEEIEKNILPFKIDLLIKQNKDGVNETKKTLGDIVKAINSIPKNEAVDLSTTDNLIKELIDSVGKEYKVDFSPIIEAIDNTKKEEIDLSDVILLLSDIKNNIKEKKIQEINVPEINFPEIEFPEIEFPEKYDLSEDTINKMKDTFSKAAKEIKVSVGGGGGLSKIVNKNGSVINPATSDKQDDIILAIEGQGETVYATNEIYENGTDTYFCKESKDGEWYIMKIDTNSVFSHSTIINNPTITTYADARTNVLTLTYGNYNQAF